MTRVVDGDTLQLSDGEKVGLIGVDTPEASNNFKLWRDAKSTGQDTKELMARGKEAAEFTRKLALGKQVRLEYDVQTKDQYGRTLAYVFIRNDFLPPKGPEMQGDVEIMLNAEIMKAGYARVVSLPPNVKYQELFMTMEKEAREKNIGMWIEASEVVPKKMGYKLGLEDATGQGNVRASNAKIGVDYKVSQNATVGVEATQGIHDSKDAAAWGKSVNDETAAQANYKLSF